MSQMDDIAPSSATATIDSFWEIGNYKRTTQRIEDGQKLSDSLMQMLQERADLEKHYAKSLMAWSRKWNENISKGPEYGTMKSTWSSVLDATNRMSNVYMDTVKPNLENVQATIKQWKTENYHQKMVGMSKEAKTLDDEFRKAQKPWAKLYTKVMKLKKDYHQGCKLALTAQNLENNARNDSNISQDAKRKTEDKLAKCNKDRDTAQEKYKASLDELTSNNPKYLEEMSMTFNKCQELEKVRLEFFKSIFTKIHQGLNISEIREIANIYEDLEQRINSSNDQSDLQWWSDHHGVDMAMYWPTFEEYSPDMHSISRKKGQGGAAMGSDGITLTSLKKDNSHTITRENSSSQQPTPPAQKSSTNSFQPSRKKLLSYDDIKLNPFCNDTEDVEDAISLPSPSAHQNNGNPFGGESEEAPVNDWQTYDQDTNKEGEDDDDSVDGVAVRAIYDYNGEEEDELTFKTGDIFMKLREKDEQGWCKGRKDGVVGLFPDNYVEFIST